MNMDSFLILGDSCIEMIIGGQPSPLIAADLKIKQYALNTQVFSSRATADRGGKNTVAASQSTAQFNNVGFLSHG